LRREIRERLRRPLVERRRGRVENGVEEGVEGGALEGPHSGEELVEDDAEAPEVGGGRRPLAHDHLGRHVARCADELAPRARERQARVLEHARQAEVGELGGPRPVEEDVPRLDVAVNDVLRVGRLEPAGDPAQNLQASLRRGMGVFFQEVLEGAAVDVLHLEHPAAVPELVDLVESDDVLAPEAGDELALGENLIPRRGVRPDAGSGEHLEGDGSLEDRVFGQIDAGEGSPAEEAHDLEFLERVAGFERSGGTHRPNHSGVELTGFA
jgi:hypothetical protein